MNLAGLLDVLKIWVQERGRGSHESGRPPESDVLKIWVQERGRGSHESGRPPGRLKDLGTREGPRIS